ncbi:A24 family peptidase [Candidatus Sororendozoicomonas aggregata]|uniref:prepilin peptidase n=1 Tax=Candidatus Sororendozoicomonas aggregata TaxID=3073239 RepID=UPI002ED57D5A
MTFFIFLQQSPGWFYLLLVILGLIAGSFLNVVIYRLPIMLERRWQQESKAALFPDKAQIKQQTFNIAMPPSFCTYCQSSIKPWENIPLISYLFLKGKCSACKTPISTRYPAVEAITALLTLLVGSYFGVTIESIAYCFFVYSLLVLTLIDIDKQLLPDIITLPLLWAGLLFNSATGLVPLQSALLGAVAGYLSLWSVYWLFKLATGKEGMGYGDFKLLAALGAWLGWQLLPMIILLSSLVGTLATLLLIALKLHKRTNPIPFGPYLSASGFIALLWGNKLLLSYLQVMGL